MEKFLELLNVEIDKALKGVQSAQEKLNDRKHTSTSFGMILMASEDYEKAMGKFLALHDFRTVVEKAIADEKEKAE